MKLRLYPSTCLTSPCVPVQFPSAEISRYGREVRAFARRCEGYALAANQVGLTGAWFVFSEHPDVSRAPWLVANPVLIETGGTFIFEESCLSLPGLTYEVARPDRVTISYQDEFGEVKRFTAEKLLGRILLHELDHLAGKLFVDRASAEDKADCAAALAKEGLPSPFGAAVPAYDPDAP